MLRSTSLRVYEVAQRLGYQDPYYFSRIFRKVVGISPKEYQNSEYFPLSGVSFRPLPGRLSRKWEHCAFPSPAAPAILEENKGHNFALFLGRFLYVLRTGRQLGSCVGGARPTP